MSLLNLFTQQRRSWQSQATDKPADYVAGGIAALNQAEVAFKATILYNVHQQAAATQDELEEVSFQLTQAHRTIKRLEDILAIAKQQAAEVPEEDQTLSARKVLQKIVVIANYLPSSPENKLRKVLKLANGFMTAHQGKIDNMERGGDAE